MDDRYSYLPNYPPRNDLIKDFGSIAAMDNLDSMSPYVYTPPNQYNPYHYAPPVSNPPANSSLYSPHSSFTTNDNGLGNCGNGLGIGGGGGDLNSDSFYPSNVSGGGGDSFGDEPPLLEELGLNFDQFMAKTMLVGNPFNSINNSSNNKSEQHLLHDNDLGDLLIDKEDSLTRSPNSPTSNLSPSNETNHQSHHHLPLSENNYVDDRSIQVIYSDNSSTSNHICDNLNIPSNNQQGNNNGNGIGRGGNSNVGGNDDHGQGNRSDSNEDNQLISSWEKPMPDELNYPFDSRIRSTNNLTNRFNGNPNLNHSNNNNLNVHPNPPHLLPKSHTIGSGQFMPSGHPTRSTPILNYIQHHRQILPTLQPTTNSGSNAAAAFTAYPSYQRPIAIQPNLGYTHKVSPRLISPYMTTNVGGREIIFWRAPLGKMYQQQTTTSSTTSTPPGSHHHPHLGSTSLGSLQESTSPIHGRMPIMISASRVSFTNSPLGGDDSSSPSSSCSTSSSSSSSSAPSTAGITMDKKLYMNNPLLVNMLTCPQIPGLRNLAPAPDSSSSHLDEKSKSEILSGLIDVSSEKRKRSHRSIATTNREPVKREMRPKIFDIEQFKIGMFHVQSSNEGLTRRNSSTQLKVIFSKRRFIYEFAFPGSYTCNKKDQNGILSVQSLSTNYRTTNSSNCGLGGGGDSVNFVPNSSNNNISRTQSNTNASTVVYYVIAVPFEHVTGLNIDESTMYLTVNRVPALFGGTSVRSKVLFEKAPRFDPSQGEIESNALHCIHLRSSQVGRLRSSLIEFDKKFADLLSNKIEIDPFSYRCKLTETSKDSKEDEKSSDFPSSDQSHVNHYNQLNHHQQHQQQLPDSVQPLKKQKVINKVDYQDVESPSQSNNNLNDIS